MVDEHRTIRSIEELRQSVPAILKRLNADQSLLLAAAANPIFALEELGYHIPSELHRELDRRIRFTTDERAKLTELESHIQKLAGERFAPDDPEMLESVLFTRLKLPALPAEPVRVPIEPSGTRPSAQQKSRQKGKPQHEPSAVAGERSLAPRPTIRLHRLAVVYRIPGSAPAPDVLEPLRGAHPVIEPLIVYRALAAKHPPFAPRELYERVRRGDIPGASFKLRARIHRDREK